MHIELIDILRCPRDHQESPLVAVFHRVENRDVIDANLGCPICGAKFPIRNGIARFAPENETRESGSTNPAEDDEAVRLAAYLNLATPGLLVVICDSWKSAFADLAAMAQPRIVGLTRKSTPGGSEDVAWLQIADRVPLAPQSADAVAIDGDFATASGIAESHRILRPGGRLLAPADVTLSGGFRELARDDRYVVAERIPELIRLSR